MTAFVKKLGIAIVVASFVLPVSAACGLCGGCDTAAEGDDTHAEAAEGLSCHGHEAESSNTPRIGSTKSLSECGQCQSECGMTAGSAADFSASLYRDLTVPRSPDHGFTLATAPFGGVIDLSAPVGSRRIRETSHLAPPGTLFHLHSLLLT